jgi:hypothetical protein
MNASDLESIPQSAAAWLLGKSSRMLRDYSDLPRNADGTYNAQRLVEWARSRSRPAADLADADLERLATLAELLWLPSDDQLPAAVGLVTELHKRYGDAVFIELVQAILAQWRPMVEQQRQLEADPAHHRRQADQARRQMADDEARAALRISTVCQCCSRIRRGRSWIKVNPPADHVVLPGRCPACAGTNG